MPPSHAHDPTGRDPAYRARPVGRHADSAAGDVAPPHPVLALQAQVGNARVARMLAQRAAAPELEDEPPDAAAASAPALPQQEDEDPSTIRAQHDLAVRRAGAGDGARPEVGPEGGPVSDALAGRIQASRGGGAALDDGTRAQMEGAFGTTFDDVRVHTGGESDALNRSLGARAFTTGSDVYFRGDAGPGDSALLAHELTHVVQQRALPAGGPMTVGPAGDAHERQADGMAAAVSAGPAAPAAAQRRLDER